MTLDIEKAKSAGYSDSEIVNFLGRSSQFDVDKARQAGYSDTEILNHLSKNNIAPQIEAPKPTATALPDSDTSSEFFQGIAHSLGDSMNDVLGQLLLRSIAGFVLFILLTYGLRGHRRETQSQNARWVGAWLAGISVLNANIRQTGIDYFAGAVVQVLTAYVIGFIAGYLWRSFRPLESISVQPTGQTAAPPTSSLTQQVSVSDKYYAQAATEYSSSERDEGLWARLFAELDGDENKVKAAYIKDRARKLSQS